MVELYKLSEDAIVDYKDKPFSRLEFIAKFSDKEQIRLFSDLCDKTKKMTIKEYYTNFGIEHSQSKIIELLQKIQASNGGTEIYTSIMLPKLSSTSIDEYLSYEIPVNLKKNH